MNATMVINPTMEHYRLITATDDLWFGNTILILSVNMATICGRNTSPFIGVVDLTDFYERLAKAGYDVCRASEPLRFCVVGGFERIPPQDAAWVRIDQFIERTEELLAITTLLKNTKYWGTNVFNDDVENDLIGAISAARLALERKGKRLVLVAE